MTQQRAETIANRLGIDAIRQEAESIHRGSPRTLGELHPIWCVGHAVMRVALRQGRTPPSWWAAWQRGSELEKLMHLVNPHTPVDVSATDDMTLCACGHYAAHPMNASLGVVCVDCYDQWSD